MDFYPGYSIEVDFSRDEWVVTNAAGHTERISIEKIHKLKTGGAVQQHLDTTFANRTDTSQRTEFYETQTDAGAF